LTKTYHGSPQIGKVRTKTNLSGKFAVNTAESEAIMKKPCAEKPFPASGTREHEVLIVRINACNKERLMNDAKHIRCSLCPPVMIKQGLL
jgi:hypothetical protein